MSEFDKMLEYVRKTNPEMTLERLKRESKKCRYGIIALNIVSKGKSAHRYAK